ncbi:MAG: hypothetical protein SFV24_16810 [Gemmatimonadales bacterium]|nr:hypothetical protein [Gemmatimonadales bacterium]
MKPRPIEEIAKAFHDIGLSETEWGREQPTLPPPELDRHLFIRIEGTTTPLSEPERDANVA